MSNELNKETAHYRRPLMDSRWLLTLILLGVVFVSFGQIPFGEEVINPAAGKA